MRWTTTDIRELRDLAAAGSSYADAAARFAVSTGSIIGAARRHKIVFCRNDKPTPEPAEALRARWAILLPLIKENLRQELAGSR